MLNPSWYIGVKNHMFTIYLIKNHARIQNDASSACGECAKALFH